jgi:tetratricopeptide (TPR) repeat protein
MSRAQADDAVQVSIKVQDESGRAIPYVCVWRFVQIQPEHARRTAFPKSHLNADDLWRLTRRYRNDCEVISRAGDMPVPYLDVPPMGSVDGQILEQVDYAYLTGRKNNYPRPNPLVFGYTFMKRGYLPGKVDFSVSGSQNRVQATVTLKRDPAQAVPTAPYAQTFDRLRYELSLPQDHSPSPENQQRLQAFRPALEAAARQAEAAGDKPTAARIYLRMRYLPSVMHKVDDQTEIYGFDQSGDPASPEAQYALDRAYALDPNNPLVWLLTLNRRGDVPASAPRDDRIRRNIQQLNQLIATHGDKVWPWAYNWRAGSYIPLKEYAKARELILQAAQFEPRYTDWDKEIESLKLGMKREKVPVPADW